MATFLLTFDVGMVGGGRVLSLIAVANAYGSCFSKLMKKVVGSVVGRR